EGGVGGEAAWEQALSGGRAVAEKHGARRQDDRLAAGVVHGAERAGIARFAFDLDHARLEAQLARRLGGRVALLARNRVKCDTEDGRARACVGPAPGPFWGAPES